MKTLIMLVCMLVLILGIGCNKKSRITAELKDGIIIIKLPDTKQTIVIHGVMIERNVDNSGFAKYVFGKVINISDDVLDVNLIDTNGNANHPLAIIGTKTLPKER